MKNSAGRAYQNHFATVPNVRLPRSTFPRNFRHLTAFNTGYLVPIFHDEILPGDTIELETAILARLATPEFPYMDDLSLDVHYFFVPNRLIWSNWEKFCGAQANPADSTAFTIPQMSMSDYASFQLEDSIFDYMGYPTVLAGSPIQARAPSALPFRAYNLIWNEWYRNQNLQTSVVQNMGNGPDTTQYALLRRNRRKDYFTSALPWPQKGTAVSLPLGTTAPIIWGNNFGTGGNAADGKFVVAQKSAAADWAGARYGNSLGVNTGLIPDNGVFNQYADLSNATAATINQLRQAFQLQSLFERDARTGTRYVEVLLGHFGVVSPDFRLQRPEYLGGKTIPITVNPVAQTSETASGTPQGNLAAFATAHGKPRIMHSFVEHGQLLALASVRAQTTYQNGVNRMYNRRTRYDFYWPDFAHLGEQAISQGEIFYDGTAADDTVFGYIPRYDEYRWRPGMVTGPMRSTHSQSLDAWHLALDPANAAAITLANLIAENAPVDRILSVPAQSGPQLIFDSYNYYRHTRVMPVNSQPYSMGL